MAKHLKRAISGGPIEMNGVAVHICDPLFLLVGLPYKARGPCV